MQISSFLCAVTAVLGPFLVAQPPITIEDGMTNFRYVSFPNLPTSNAGAMRFSAAGIGVSHLFQSWWYYAIAGDTTGSAFNTSGRQMTAAPAADGRSVQFDWANVDNRNFAARLVNCVYSYGGTAGLSAQTMCLTNNTSAALAIRIYSYLDLDVGGTPDGDSAAQMAGLPPGLHSVADSADSCFATALNADGYEVATWPSLRTKILGGVGGAPYVPANAGLPFAPGDYASVYSWNVTIAPGASECFYALVAANQPPKSQVVAAATAYGLAKRGTNGNPVWSLGRPFLGTQVNLEVSNGLAGAAPWVMCGTTRVDVAIPGVGRLYVLPLPGCDFFMQSFAGANNSSSISFYAPLISTLAGISLYWQCVFIDPGAVGGLAHTGGLGWTFGTYYGR